MTAFLLSQFAALDEADARRYAALAAPTVAGYRGRYLVRGARPHVLEGDWPPQLRLSIVEFPSNEVLQAWYRSDEYAAALAVRTSSMTRSLVSIDGE